MKVKTSDLLGAVQAKIAQQELDQANWDARLEHYNVEKLENWQKETRDGWVDYRNAITALLRRPGPITKNDVPDRPEAYKPSFAGTWREDKPGVFCYRGGDHPYQWGDRPRIDTDLLQLQSFLSAVTDETVTLAALKQAGFGKLNQLFGYPRPAS